MSEAKTILITGCSSGFGRVAAEFLATRGYRVFAGMRELSGRNAAAAAELRALSPDGRSLRVVELDVCSDASVEAAVRQTIEEAVHIDVLINNAGFPQLGVTEAFTLEQFQKVFDTNFFGAVRMNRAVLPHMRRRGSGLLIHISSVAGRIVVPAQGIYCASKFALEAIAEAFRYELAPLGIDSVLIEPGVYPTAIFGKIMTPGDAARAAEYGRAGDIGERVAGWFNASLKSADIPDPREIGQTIVELIEMPLGRRPLRTILPASRRDLVQAYNEMSAQIQKGVFEMLGLSDLLEPRARASSAD